MPEIIIKECAECKQEFIPDERQKLQRRENAKFCSGFCRNKSFALKEPPQNKVCKICKIKKEINNFYQNKNKNTFHAYCKECAKNKSRKTVLTPEQREKRNEYNRRRRATPEYKQKDKEYRELNKERLKRQQKKWYEENRDKHGFNLRKSALIGKERNLRQKNSTLKYKYGINLDDYNKMLSLQKNCCFICNLAHSDKKPLVVDHCHISGKVRGLLCHKCNSAIGLLNDNLELAQNAVKYLSGHQISGVKCCLRCGKQFISKAKKPYQRLKRKYCSDKCARLIVSEEIESRIKRNCLNCRNDFAPSGRSRKLQESAKFCSRPCSNKFRIKSAKRPVVNVLI